MLTIFYIFASHGWTIGQPEYQSFCLLIESLTPAIHANEKRGATAISVCGDKIPNILFTYVLTHIFNKLPQRFISFHLVRFCLFFFVQLNLIFFLIRIKSMHWIQSVKIWPPVVHPLTIYIVFHKRWALSLSLSSVKLKIKMYKHTFV